MSGVKGALAVKIYGDDLKTLEAKGDEIVDVLRGVRGVEDLGLFRVLGQPNLDFSVDRDQSARYGINVSDVQDAIQTAVGGNALTQVLVGEQRYDLVLRYLPQYRDTREAIEKNPITGPVRRTRFLGAVDEGQGVRWRFRNLPGSQLPVHRGQIQRAGKRPGQHRRRGHPKGEVGCQTAIRLYDRLGGRV